MPKILIIEDEKELAENISAYLSDDHYLCELAGSYEEARARIADHQYDCILLDLTLPGGDGMKLLEGLKQQNRPEGVIIVSAKDSIDDKIQGLQMGADDYLAKPFHMSELAARIFSVIRRKSFLGTNLLELNELSIDLLSKTLKVQGHPGPLTKSEFELLLLFIGNKNKVISKSALAEHLSGDWADLFDNHDFVYAHIKNLKKKLSDGGARNYLKTVYGMGYKWEV